MKIYKLNISKVTSCVGILLFSSLLATAQCDAPAYIEAEDVVNGQRGYSNGELVSRNGVDYKAIYGTWTSTQSQDWAYAPGTGSMWEQAWTVESDPCVNTGINDGTGNGDGTDNGGGNDSGGGTDNSGGNDNGGGTSNGSSCIVTEDDGQAQATYYTLLESGASTVVNCSFDAVADIKGTFYGALETVTLHGSGAAKYCGMCVEMTGPKSTEIVHITDECPDCHEHNSGDTDIDLSTPAFNAIVGPIGIGRADITWKEVSCPWTTPLQVIVQGSNQWYAKVIIANHTNRIANVEVQQAGSWFALTRGTDNGWESKGVTSNEVSKSFRITDIYGEEIIVTGISFNANPTNSKNYAQGNTNFPACGLTSSEKVINSLNYVSIFPNPANNNITLEGLEDVETIQIINLNGQVMLTEFLGGSASVGSIDISNLASGIYVAKMTGLNNTGTATFVKK